jgi:hypothetical protein
VRVQRCLDAGPGFRYEYDLFTFTGPEAVYVARSYLSEPDEAHILRKEVDGVQHFVSAEDLGTETFLEFEVYLREHGKARLSYLSTEAEGYVEIPR